MIIKIGKFDFEYEFSTKKPAINNFSYKYSFLSNFHPCKIIDYGNNVWRTAEHLYQASKTRNADEKALILNAETPSKAKRLGRKVTLIPEWDSVKDPIMYAVLFQKFIQNRDLADMLRDTGDTELIEGNYWHDNYWGACVCRMCKGVEKKNTLGRLLMVVRKSFSY
jgi:ribA/ribD-fused uncharacterized protein